MKKNFVILFLLLFEPLLALVDLEKNCQSFVIKTEQIVIAGYPDAFNPSIVRWNNHFLMSFRTRNPETKVADLIGLIWLDEHFKPMGKPQILNMNGLKHVQDPRLVFVDNRLYMPFSAQFAHSGKHERRMCIGELVYDGHQFSMVRAEPLLHFEGDQRKFEKNWVPFAYNDYLLLSYTISPHKVVLPLFGEQKCLTVDYSEFQNSWKWGEIRGGTPALLVDGHYLAFFHSSIDMESAQSGGKKMPHYFMGAYTFNSSPPFYVNRVSSEPIVGANFYNGKVHKTWKPLRVVFPCGFVFDKNTIWVTYGRQDHEIWIVKLDKKGLLNSLSQLQNSFAR